MSRKNVARENSCINEKGTVEGKGIREISMHTHSKEKLLKAMERQKLEDRHKKIKQRLQTFDCGILMKSESWTRELLYKPGSSRLLLIEWMLTKINGSPLPSYSISYSREINFKMYILQLGMMSSSEIDTEGTKAFEIQTKFFSDLTFLTEIAIRNDEQRRKKIYEKNVNFLASLARGNTAKSLSSDCQLIPPNIQAQYSAKTFTESYLQSIGKQLREKIEKIQKQLENHGTNSKSGNIDGESKKKEVVKKVETNLQECAQLMADFNQIFSTTIIPWCARVKPAQRITDFDAKAVQLSVNVAEILQFSTNWNTIESFENKLETILSQLRTQVVALRNEESLLVL